MEYAIKHAYQLTVEAFGWNSERGTVGGDIVDSIGFAAAKGTPGAARSSHAFRRIASDCSLIMEYALSSPLENAGQTTGDITVSAREIDEGQVGGRFRVFAVHRRTDSAEVCAVCCVMAGLSASHC